MRKKIWFAQLAIMGVLFLFTISCKKDKNNDDTPPPPVTTVTDFDGNVYQTITIGTQVWMAENLKVTHYCNGDAIPNVTDGTQWSNLTTGAYCNYSNDVNYAASYGRLYNWHTVSDSRNICPAGWHVPSDAEWVTLTDYLGGIIVAGGKMKETGTTHWNSPNTGATNESGFTALPAGKRSNSGTFSVVGSSAVWWTSTEYNTSSAWNRSISCISSGIDCSGSIKQTGVSVRCLKD